MSKPKPKRYRNLSMPAEFISEIERFIKDRPKLGYSSMSEFVKAATRAYMEQYKESEKNQRRKKT